MTITEVIQMQTIEYSICFTELSGQPGQPGYPGHFLITRFFIRIVVLYKRVDNLELNFKTGLIFNIVIINRSVYFEKYRLTKPKINFNKNFFFIDQDH